MQIGNRYQGFDISSKGLSVQRKKMNVIAENIANADTTRTEDGTPYKRKFIRSTSSVAAVNGTNSLSNQNQVRLLTSNENHIMQTPRNVNPFNDQPDLNAEIFQDDSVGEYIFMPNHPDADEKGYIESSNVNIINEMVEMIEAARNYEANLTALKSSKEMTKDSLEI